MVFRDAMLKDTLNEIDVWLIGAYPFKDFPVYHYCFPDEEKGELYLSSRTGDALQFTTWKSRFWAWVGAIPTGFMSSSSGHTGVNHGKTLCYGFQESVF